MADHLKHMDTFNDDDYAEAEDAKDVWELTAAVQPEPSRDWDWESVYHGSDFRDEEQTDYERQMLANWKEAVKTRMPNADEYHQRYRYALDQRIQQGHHQAQTFYMNLLRTCYAHD